MNWRIYAAAVAVAANQADSLGKRDKDQEARFVAAITTVVADARVLNELYQSKASAFDSTLEQIRKAVDQKDLDQARTLTITLRDTLPVKANLFFSPVKQIQGALRDLTGHLGQIVNTLFFEEVITYRVEPCLGFT